MLKLLLLLSITAKLFVFDYHLEGDYFLIGGTYHCETRLKLDVKVVKKIKENVLIKLTNTDSIKRNIPFTFYLIERNNIKDSFKIFKEISGQTKDSTNYFLEVSKNTMEKYFIICYAISYRTQGIRLLKE
jgi:hypothetical protein